MYIPGCDCNVRSSDIKKLHFPIQAAAVDKSWFTRLYILEDEPCGYYLSIRPRLPPNILNPRSVFGVRSHDSIFIIQSTVKNFHTTITKASDKALGRAVIVRHDGRNGAFGISVKILGRRVI